MPRDDGHLPLAARNRLMCLDASLRAWARVDPYCRLELRRHVVDGAPLGHVLGVLALRYGEGTLDDLVPLPDVPRAGRARRCSSTWPDGVCCMAVATRSIPTEAGQSSAEVCEDCAARPWPGWTPRPNPFARWTPGVAPARGRPAADPDPPDDSLE